MKKIKIPVLILLLAVLNIPLIFSDGLSREKVGTVFTGLDYYKSKVPYSGSIGGVYLGYTADGSAEKGLAFVQEKIYEKITVIVEVENSDGDFIVNNIEIPDINRIKDENKRKLLIKAGEDFRGKVIRGKNDEPEKIDAVTGATRFNKKMYETVNMLTENLIKEMESSPPWKKVRLKK